jgi:hypothetical protein
MPALYDFIVKPIGERYANKQKIGNKTLILNTKIESFKHVNKTAEVIEVPRNNFTPIKKGDLVIIHHNVFRRYYDIKGRAKDSSNYFKENKYFCYIDQIFLYKRDNTWYTPPGYCFVKPIYSKNYLDTNKEEPLVGVLKHLGSDLRDFNLNNDDLIGFTPNSEYEFIIDKEKLYRVPINSISIKYGKKKNEVEYNPSWV